jgi:hypothetical protein
LKACQADGIAAAGSEVGNLQRESGK